MYICDPKIRQGSTYLKHMDDTFSFLGRGKLACNALCDAESKRGIMGLLAMMVLLHPSFNCIFHLDYLSWHQNQKPKAPH